MKIWDFNNVICNKHITIFLRHVHNYEYEWYFGSLVKHQICVSHNKYIIHVWKKYVYNYFLEEKLVYFYQYPLDASFHQILGTSINNDYANLCIWILLKLLKIVHIGKYFILLKNDMKLILKVLTRRSINSTYIFMFEINPLKVVIIWFTKESQFLKILIKMIYFHKIPLKILTHRKLYSYA
jgi:hypothetical protein